MRRPHEVPLSKESMLILHEIWSFSEYGELVFPSIRSMKKPLSENAKENAELCAELLIPVRNATFSLRDSHRSNARSRCDFVTGCRVLVGPSSPRIGDAAIPIRSVCEACC
jgi:hypothetical protein